MRSYHSASPQSQLRPHEFRIGDRFVGTFGRPVEAPETENEMKTGEEFRVL